MPLFPLWLALLMRLSGAALPLRLLHLTSAAWRGIACGSLYAITRLHFGERAAGYAAALYVLDPWEAYWSGWVLKEAVSVPLFLLSVQALSAARVDPRPGKSGIAGIMIGLATLARLPCLALLPVGIFLVPPAPAIDAPVEASGAPAVPCGAGGISRPVDNRVCMAVATTAMIAPWLLLSGRLRGCWQYIPQHVLAGFLIQFSPLTGFARDGFEWPRREDPRLTLPEHPLERVPDRLGKLVSELAAYEAARPELLLRRLGARVVNMWRPAYRSHPRPIQLLLGTGYCLLSALSVSGMVVAITRRLPCVALLGPLLVTGGLHLVFWSGIRFRQYLMPLLYAFGGLALATGEQALALPSPGSQEVHSLDTKVTLEEEETGVTALEPLCLAER